MQESDQRKGAATAADVQVDEQPNALIACRVPDEVFNDTRVKRVPPPLQALLNLLSTLTTNNNIIRKHHCPWRLLTSSVNLSITMANKKKTLEPILDAVQPPP